MICCRDRACPSEPSAERASGLQESGSSRAIEVVKINAAWPLQATRCSTHKAFFRGPFGGRHGFRVTR